MKHVVDGSRLLLGRIVPPPPPAKKMTNITFKRLIFSFIYQNRFFDFSYPDQILYIYFIYIHIYNNLRSKYWCTPRNNIFAYFLSCFFFLLFLLFNLFYFHILHLYLYIYFMKETYREYIYSLCELASTQLHKREESYVPKLVWRSFLED